MLFENTEREIISHVFNADPKMISTIRRIYNLNAELMRDEFKQFLTIFGVFSLFAVIFYHHHDFEHWPILNFTIAMFIGLQISGSMIAIVIMFIDYVKGNIKLKIFNKILKSYEENLTTLTKENTNERK